MNEAVRQAAACVDNFPLPEVDRALAGHEFEVIAVLAEDPKFVRSVSMDHSWSENICRSKFLVAEPVIRAALNQMKLR